MLLSVRNLTKQFSSAQRDLCVLDGVSLELDAGQSLALTGESGSGKSTFLHIIGGLEEADAGEVLIGGYDVTTLSDDARARLRRGTIGLVFQQFNLIPSLDVAANIAFQARIAGRHDDARCGELAERLGLSDLLAQYPEQLSGGQQQRVAVARALASRPALILADEPTGNLDEASGDVVIDLMLALAHESDAALLMVTHSDRIANRLDKRLHLRRGAFAS